MSSASATTLPDNPTAQELSSFSADSVDFLAVGTRRLAAILSARGLCGRVTLGKNTIVVGDQRAADRDTAEFIFVSEAVFQRLFRHLRLFDFAMAYLDGDLKISGPMPKAVDVLDAMNTATDRRQTFGEYVKLLLFRVVKAITPARAQKFDSLDHYAQSARAYELFLDDRLQYTCGRFETGTEDIDQAQSAKFRMIEGLANKYHGPLKGKDHLDIGCGWGGMMSYFRDEIGTRSIGNTNSPHQAEYARRRFNCDVIFGDFDVLKNSERRFDLITVVGMIEHLTPYRRSQLLKIVRRLLKDDGVLYLQSVCKPAVWFGGDAYRIAQREVFPGHYLETPAETATRLTKSGFTVLEQFEHGHDYGHTLARWAEKTQQNEAEMTALVGPRQYRLYLGYLAFGAKLYFNGEGSLFRCVAKKS
jgi:cyclopropane-fatty-acyl-phospholipid synthase